MLSLRRLSSLIGTISPGILLGNISTSVFVASFSEEEFGMGGMEVENRFEIKHSLDLLEVMSFSDPVLVEVKEEMPMVSLSFRACFNLPFQESCMFFK